jgi:hypothetical protein
VAQVAVEVPAIPWVLVAPPVLLGKVLLAVVVGPMLAVTVGVVVVVVPPAGEAVAEPAVPRASLVELVRKHLFVEYQNVLPVVARQ